MKRKKDAESLLRSVLAQLNMTLERHQQLQAAVSVLAGDQVQVKATEPTPGFSSSPTEARRADSPIP